MNTIPYWAVGGHIGVMCNSCNSSANNIFLKIKVFQQYFVHMVLVYSEDTFWTNYIYSGF